jgi:hypothetical protein
MPGWELWINAPEMELWPLGYAHRCRGKIWPARDGHVVRTQVGWLDMYKIFNARAFRFIPVGAIAVLERVWSMGGFVGYITRRPGGA